MNSFAEILPRITTLTFDCYGTLIDWDAGLWGVFRTVFPDIATARRRELFDAYVSVEADVEGRAYKSYREVTAEVMGRLAEQFKRRLAPGQRELLAQRIPEWAPFADTTEALRRLKKRFRLGVLSNIDRDLFAGTAKQLGVPFDFVVTAEDVGSYKPAEGHFRRLLESHATAGEVLHVAQSVYHDGVPAKRLGIAFAWINRYNDANVTSATPLIETPDLKAFAEAVGA